MHTNKQHIEISSESSIHLLWKGPLTFLPTESWPFCDYCSHWYFMYKFVTLHIPFKYNIGMTSLWTVWRLIENWRKHFLWKYMWHRKYVVFGYHKLWVNRARDVFIHKNCCEWIILSSSLPNVMNWRRRMNFVLEQNKKNKLCPWAGVVARLGD